MDALKVFISYRRADTQHVAGRLGDRIGTRFTLFMDIDDIPLGVDFTTALNEAVNSSDVLVVLIGQRFFGTNPVLERRAGQSRDWVVAEVSAAFDRGLVVIPVLVDSAEMPEEEQLPEALWPLRRRQALRLSHASFNTDVEKLVDALAQIENTKQAPTPVRAAEPAPSRDALFRDPDYSRAVAAAYRKQWSEAVELFSDVRLRFPTDARVSTQLAEARAADAEARGEWYEAVTALQALAAARSEDSSIETRLTQARREVEIGDLVGQLRALAAAEEWAGVTAMSQRIAELDPDRADPDGLAETARTWLEDRDIEDRYARGLADLQQGNPRAAYAVFEEISRQRPGYREVNDILRMARERLDSAGRPEPSRPLIADPVVAEPVAPAVPAASGGPDVKADLAEPVAPPLAGSSRIWLVAAGVVALQLAVALGPPVFWRASGFKWLLIFLSIAALLVVGRLAWNDLRPVAADRQRRLLNWSLGATGLGVVGVLLCFGFGTRMFYGFGYYLAGDVSARAYLVSFLTAELLGALITYLVLRHRLGTGAIWPALLFLASALLTTVTVMVAVFLHLY